MPRRVLAEPFYKKEPKKAHGSFTQNRHAAERWTVALIKKYGETGVDAETLRQAMRTAGGRGEPVTLAFAEKFLQRLMTKRLLVEKDGKYTVPVKAAL